VQESCGDDGGVNRKRPCRICRRWYLPSSRQGDRQRVCSSEACQGERRRQTQARWRAENPEYFTARRLAKLPGREAAEAVAAAAPTDAAPAVTMPEPSRVGAPLDRLPWDVAQDEFGAKGAEFIAVLGRLLNKPRQDAMRSQEANIAR
jgi:hypothetical protein